MGKLILGCGYVGLRVARQWRDAGCRVTVVTRSESRAAELAQEGLTPLVADVTVPDQFPQLPPSQTMLYAVGFDRQAGKSMETVYVEGLRTTLAHLPSPPTRIIYLSSTGVYGELPPAGDGHVETTQSEPHPWMDESSPCYPTREGGIVCLAAENILRAHAWADRTTILRLAGIYGPGRVPRREQFLSPDRIAQPLDGYLNLIHVDDAVRVILAAENAEIAAGNLYIVSDGHPVRRVDYYDELARCFGAPAPIVAASSSGTLDRRRSTSSKRLKNTKMLSELGIELAYPSYREGLAAIVTGTAT